MYQQEHAAAKLTLLEHEGATQLNRDAKPDSKWDAKPDCWRLSQEKKSKHGRATEERKITTGIAEDSDGNSGRLRRE